MTKIGLIELVYAIQYVTAKDNIDASPESVDLLEPIEDLVNDIVNDLDSPQRAQLSNAHSSYPDSPLSEKK